MGGEPGAGAEDSFRAPRRRFDALRRRDDFFFLAMH